MSGAMAEVIAGSFYVFHDGEETDFVRACVAVCQDSGFKRSDDPYWSAFAIAPRLTRILSAAEYSAPNNGTLIFHPSALPYGRGPDAIRWAVERGERVSAVTWFFADAGKDTGPICSQAPVVLLPGESAGRAYHTRFVPAGIEALRAAVGEYRRNGRFTRRPQDEALATYDGRYQSDGQPINANGISASVASDMPVS